MQRQAIRSSFGCCELSAIVFFLSAFLLSCSVFPAFLLYLRLCFPGILEFSVQFSYLAGVDSLSNRSLHRRVLTCKNINCAHSKSCDFVLWDAHACQTGLKHTRFLLTRPHSIDQSSLLKTHSWKGRQWSFHSQGSVSWDENTISPCCLFRGQIVQKTINSFARNMEYNPRNQ